MSLKINFLIISIVWIGQRNFADTNFDLNDILDVNFMPGTLLMIDQNSEDSTKLDNSTMLPNGTFIEAFNTMKFHRKMFNEYLCRNFLADQILQEFQPVKFNKRFGIRPMPFIPPVPVVSNGSTMRSSRKGRVTVGGVNVKDSLLSDPGSSNYKDWLKKTTTLDDIYRHYGFNNKIDEDVDDDDGIEVETPREDFDTDITGYAVASSSKLPQNMPKVGQTSYGGVAGGYSASGGGGGYYSGGHYGSSAHGQEYQQYQVPQFVHYHHVGGGDKKKEMILKDLFDVALTALAFLSFGIFAIQVILCIAATKTTTTTTTTQATFLSMVDGTSGTGTGMGTASASNTGPEIIINSGFRPASSSSTFVGSGYGRRHRRDTDESETPMNNQLVNELARRVLVSMEAIFIARQDNANCLRREICANNKFSRSLKNLQKIWIPIYGLALSWLSGRLVTNMPSSPAMIESLKASLLGLGNADCDAIYSGCDLYQEREVRRRRRRRRRKRTVNVN